MRKLPLGVVLASCLVLSAAPVAAQADIGFRAWGLRVGLADDPDQVIGGAHFDLGEFVDQLRFEPSVELGLGDDATVIVGTLPVHWMFSVSGSAKPYAGGGISLSWINFDDDGPGNDDDSDFEIGARAIGGVEWGLSGGSTFKLEASIAAPDDVHDIRVIAGWTF